MGALLAVDHGTTRTKALVLDEDLQIRAQAAVHLRQQYPHSGWVEQDPLEIVEVTRRAISTCLAQVHLRLEDLSGLGLANQGETVVVWERATGTPVGPAIVWQDRRTTEMCAVLAAQGCEPEVRRRTGLRLDPYFSATKIRWILDDIEAGQARAEHGELLAGTTDTWLLWKLSGGAIHVTDVSTASRTLLMNIHTLEWDPWLLDLFKIPRTLLPALSPSIGPGVDLALDDPGSGRGVPVLALAVDQQAALFGHGCHRPGMAKVTYGTGAFALMHAGTTAVPSQHGLLTTVAWGRAGRAEYALDGGVFVAGAAVQWLADRLALLPSVQASTELASAVPDSGGVVVVPSLAGLAAPYWDPRARGAVFGLTLATTRAHLVRATLEGIAHQVDDVMDAMAKDAGVRLELIRVDGGPSQNDALMQIQADVLGIPVEVATMEEATAFGVGAMAGVARGWWPPEVVEAAWRPRARFLPRISEAARRAQRRAWAEAVAQVRAWAPR